MNETIHNDDYDVKLIDGAATNSNDPIKGNYNKIKLKILTRAVMLEVQEAYMKEEMEQVKDSLKEAKKSQEKTTGKEKREARNKILVLKTELNDLKVVYDEYIRSHKRFTDIAKKALSLPDENYEEMKVSIKELEDEGLNWINVDETSKKVELNTENIVNDITSPYKDAHTTLEKAQEEGIFSSIDSAAIKEEIDKFMNSKVDSEGEKKSLADVATKKLTSDNFENLTKEISDNVNQVKMDDVNSLLNSSGTLNNSEKEETNDKENPTNSDETKEDTIVKINDILGIQEGEWITHKKTDTTDSIPFDGDTSFKQFLTSRQEEIDRKSIEVNELESNVGELEKTADDKKAILEEETNKSKNAEADMALIEQQLEELKRLDEEEKRLSAQESELNEKQQKLNDEISEYDEKIGMIQQQNAAKLERYKAMQEEIKKYLGKYSDNYTTGEEERGLPRNVLR